MIELYNAVAEGWDPPTRLTLHEYKTLCRVNQGPLSAFANACGFGGVWGGGYPRADHNTFETTRRVLLRDCTPGSRFHLCNFLEVQPYAASFSIYCDPPYAGTSKYKGRVDFDHTLFWSLVRRWESFGVPVLVSEYKAPADFRCVESKAQKSTTSRDKTVKPRLEALWRLASKT